MNNKEALKLAYIIDIDGILSRSELREQFKEEIKRGDFSWFNNMIPHFSSNMWATRLAKALSHEYVVIFLTARNEQFRQETCTWLNRHIGISNFKLIMRKEEGGSDYDTKKELYLQKIRGRYHVLAAIDDTKEINKLWKELNIPSLYLWDESETKEQT